MIDKFLYKFFESLDNLISYVESFIIKCTEWCWQSRVKILKRNRKKKKK